MGLAIRLPFLMLLVCLSSCQQGRPAQSSADTHAGKAPASTALPNMTVTQSEIANLYAAWEDKGAFHEDQRLTLLTEHLDVRIGEPVTVWHVFETTAPNAELYIMGPKPVPGEYVDERLATASPPEGSAYPWQVLYDGAVLPSPGIDTHWEPSTYTFDKPGTHSIQWKVNGLESNTVVIKVMDK
jgi:hypothetical protein